MISSDFDILEELCEGKVNDAKKEDRLVIVRNDNGTLRYVAVIDGATSSGELNGKAGGIVAAEAIAAEIPHLPADATPRMIIDRLTDALGVAIGDWPDPAVQRPCAAMVIWSAALETIIRVGDAHFRLDDTNYPGEKEVDKIAYTFRSTVVQGKILKGTTTVEEERAIPVQQQPLWPLVTIQGVFENNPTHPLGYANMNGLHVPDKFIETYPTNEVRSFVLCSDGFFEPFPTLKDGLDDLAWKREHDPLLAFTVNGSRPFPPGATYFDDTTYIRFVRR